MRTRVVLLCVWLVYGCAFCVRVSVHRRQASQLQRMTSRGSLAELRDNPHSDMDIVDGPDEELSAVRLQYFRLSSRLLSSSLVPSSVNSIPLTEYSTLFRYSPALRNRSSPQAAPNHPPRLCAQHQLARQAGELRTGVLAGIELRHGSSTAGATTSRPQRQRSSATARLTRIWKRTRCPT